MAFAVLFVCTGNICRSPFAERLLRHRVGQRTPIEVASAGTAALVGWPIDAPCAAQLRELGVDPDGHAARRLDTTMIDAADLILTATAAHRSDVIQAAPSAFRRTFTMREFARLGEAGQRLINADDAALRARVAATAARRGSVTAPSAYADDIADPFGAPLPLVEHSTRQLSAAVDGVITALGAGRPAPRSTTPTL